VRIGDLRADDVPVVARLHRAAFPGFFLSSLGEPFLVQFYRGFLTDPTAVTAVARDDGGTILGAVVGTTEPAGFFGRLLRRRFAGFVLASARAVLRHPTSAPRLLRAVTYRGDAGSTADGALLSSIFVVPAAQGSGAGQALLAAWARAAADRGAGAAFLTTDAEDNDRVNDFYVAQGWALADSHRTREGRLMNRYTITLGGR
jgi:ribosomal protein S18 acetylase RimI-like enzyme